MVNLDLVLLHRARQLIDGANAHRLKELIFAYEQAVSLHNSGRHSHYRYHDECEHALRTFVTDHAIAASLLYGVIERML